MQVIDNFLPANDFNGIKALIMSEHFGWYFRRDVAGVPGQPADDFYFTHMLYDNEQPMSDWFRVVEPLLKRLDIKHLLRVKTNLYPNVGVQQLNTMHRDELFSHRGAVFSLNTNNGFTRFEDGTEVQSVENRVLLFDPSVPHCSAHCTDAQRRVNINFNFF